MGFTEDKYYNIKKGLNNDENVGELTDISTVFSRPQHIKLF